MCRMAHFGNCDPETADQEYCIFHKPDKSEEEAREFYNKFVLKFFGYRLPWNEGWVFAGLVNANGFVFPKLPKITNPQRKTGEEFSFEGAVFEGHISFESTIFEGDVSFRSVKLISSNKSVFKRTHFKHRAYFNNATLKNVWFLQATFSGCVEFDGAIFEGENTSFSATKFKKSAKFTESTFDCIAIFSDVVFEDIVEFGHPEKRETRFKKTSNFKRGVFMGNVNFEKVVFEDNTEFDSAYFHKNVRFHQSKFHGTKNRFSNVYFGGRTLFSETYFRCGVTFEGAEFHGAAIFKGSIFSSHECPNTSEKTCLFKLTLFRDISNFSEVKFQNDVIFDRVIFERIAVFVETYNKEPKPKFTKSVRFSNCDFRQGVNLLGTNELDDDISKLEMQFRKLFNPKFPRSMQEAARIQRLSFEKEGKREEADKMFILEMRARREINKKKSKMYLVFEYVPELILADLIALYGTKGRRILFSTLFVILFNAMIYYILSTCCSTWRDPIFRIPIGSIYNSEAPKCVSNGVPGFLNALYYSLVTFTTLGYGDMHPTGWLKALSALEALTGAVFMALIVAVIARKWMR